MEATLKTLVIERLKKQQKFSIAYCLDAVVAHYNYVAFVDHYRKSELIEAINRLTDVQLQRLSGLNTFKDLFINNQNKTS